MFLSAAAAEKIIAYANIVSQLKTPNKPKKNQFS